MLQAVLLGLMQIFQQRACGAGGVFPLIQSQGRQLRQAEVIAERFFRVLFLEPGLRLSAEAADRAGGSSKRCRVVADDLHRLDPGNLGAQQAHLRLHHVELARGHVRPGDPGVLSVQVHAGQIVVGLILQHRRIGHRAGRDHPDHIPVYQPFGQRRILHLFADSHLVSLFNQLLDVGIHGMKRHAAHGRPLLQAAVLARQRQFKLFGGRFRVLKEQLVKVPEPEQEQAVRIRVVDPQILLHHG